jgi:hypothetical protein
VGVRDLALALVLDVGQLELLAEDAGELLERDVDLEEVVPLAAAEPPTGSPGLPSPCPTPPRCLSPKRKRGMSI